MKKRILAVILAAVLTMTLLPTAALAAGRNYGNIPIYIGDSRVDYMAEEILKNIPTQGKSAVEQIRAVYDWMIQNCGSSAGSGGRYFDADEVMTQAELFYEKADAELQKGNLRIRPEFEEGPVYDANHGAYVVSCDSNQYIANYAYEMMLYRTGDAAHDAALLALLLGHLGFDCRLIAGSLTGGDGSGAEHKWNYVLVDGLYYWLDVSLDRANYDAAAGESYQYFLVEDTAEWTGSHSWDDTYSSWLASSGADIAESYGYSAALVSGEPWSRCSAWAEDQMKQAYQMGLIPERLQNQDLTGDISRTEFAAVAVAMYERLTGTKVPSYAGQSPFSDTADADVLRAYGLGIVQGVGGGRFAPDNTLTRAEAMTMLGRVCELIVIGAISDGSGLLSDGVQKFADDETIPDYARNYIYYFAANGVVEGVGGNVLAPREEMTRESAVKMAVEAAKRQ